MGRMKKGWEGEDITSGGGGLDLCWFLIRVGETREGRWVGKRETGNGKNIRKFVRLEEREDLLFMIRATSKYGIKEPSA